MTRRFRFFLGALLLSTLSGLAQNPAPSPATPPSREHLLMDFGWKFALGNADDVKLDYGFGAFWSFLAKQDIQPGALGSTFDDSKWKTVQLPHDWAMDLPFDKKAQGNWGYRPIGRNYPATSIGWYRKTFEVPASDQGRRFYLEFEGVNHDCVVAVNGIFVGTHFSGYTSFGFDITDMIHCGAKNVVVVRADARLNEGWWYQGAGIYRNVWLTKTAPVHVPQWGTQVLTSVNGATAQVTSRTTVANDSDQAADVVVHATLLDADGSTVASAATPAQHVEAWQQAQATPELTVTNPKLWSPDTPNLYRLVTTLEVGGAEVDRTETNVGIRTIQFDADRGFLLNGQVTKIKGFCDHQQHAGVGSAVPDALWYWRLKQLKAIGCNAIRIGAKPATPAFLDACDKMGFLVLDEVRLCSSGKEGLDQVDSLVRRDRNHPCVFLWDAGNEEWGLQSNATGAAVVGTIQRRFHELDPSRLVTFAASNGGVTVGVNSVIDVRGINYLILFDTKLRLKQDKTLPHDETPELYHEHHPKQPIIGTEETGQASEGNQPASYLNQGRAAHWSYIASHPWYSGAFIWTGFAYYGECAWPHTVAEFGALDLCGFPRAPYYYFLEQWTGKKVSPPPAGGPAAKIEIDPDRPTVQADGEDVSVVNLSLLDAKGQLATSADNPLTFALTGPGTIIGVGNGQETSHEPDKGNHRNAWQGHAQVLIQTTKEAGTLHLTVSAKGLPAASIDIDSQSATPRPCVP